MFISSFENILSSVENTCGHQGKDLTQDLKRELERKHSNLSLSYNTQYRQFTVLNSATARWNDIKSVIDKIDFKNWGLYLENAPDREGNKVITIYSKRSKKRPDSTRERDRRPETPAFSGKKSRIGDADSLQFKPAPAAPVKLAPTANVIIVQPEASTELPVDKAVQEFFKTKGFQAEAGDTLYHGQYIGECQGSRETRIAAKKLSQIFPEAMHPDRLRNNRYVNIQTYLILAFKRIAHAFTIEGKINILGKNVLLEGFCEAFTVPMLASSFREGFSNVKTPFNVEKIAKQFLETTFSDTTTNEDIERIVATIKSADFKGPLCIGSGTDWHYTKIIFYRNYFFNLNRGRNFTIGKIDRNILIPEKLKVLVKRFETVRPEGIDIDPGKDFLQSSEIIATFNLKFMKAPNCTYANSKAGLLALMMIDYYESNVNEGEAKFSAQQKWKLIFCLIRPFYKQITKYDRSKLGIEFMQDLNACKIPQTPDEQQKKIIECYRDMFRRLVDKMQKSPHKFSTDVVQHFNKIRVAEGL